MKFKSAGKSGNLIVELEPGNTRLINNLNGPITDLKKLLVPIDFSDCSRHALKYATAFAKQFGSEITLLSVVQDKHTAFEYGNLDFADMLEARRKRTEEELARLAREQLREIRHRTVVQLGEPFEEIIQAARDSDTDLIIISTHGNMGLRKIELGSTAERVIRYATCPVLVVRQKEREFVPPV